jgi:surfeit locus 1 family protein
MSEAALRAVILVAAIAAAATTARLGWWQWDRAAQKEALQAAIDTRAALPPAGAADLAATAADGGAALLHRQVVVRGRWLVERTLFLDNRVMNTRPGFIVVTPLQWTGGTVLVQRGWVARDAAERTRLPALATPSGEVQVRGRVAAPPSRLYEFAAGASGVIRQNLDLDAFAAETGLALLPVTVLEQDADPDAALLRDWPRPAADAHKNYGYAAQWWAMSLAIVGLYVWYQLVRPRLHRPTR